MRLVRRNAGLGLASRLDGSAPHADDLRVVDCLHAVTVRSPHPCAIVNGIRLDLERDWSGVTVLTATDISGENVAVFEDRAMPVLAAKEVRYAGEPVALVAAPTRAAAIEAARHIVVDYRPLPPLLDARLMEDHDRQVHGTNNLYAHMVVQRGTGRMEGRVISGRYATEPVDALALEPQGVLAIPREGGGVALYGAIHSPGVALETLCAVLGHDRVNVVQTAMGGSFGSRLEVPCVMAAHAALLSDKTGKPVRLIYGREEDLAYGSKRHPTWVELRTAVDRVGRLLALEADILMDGGAYRTNSRQVLERAVLHIEGAYRCPNVQVQGKVVASHNPPSGLLRGSGVPQVNWAIERHLDRIARELSIDPLFVRRPNLVGNGNATLDGRRGAGTPQRVLEAVRDHARLNPAPPPRVSSEDARRLVAGQGLALARFSGGPVGSTPEERRGVLMLELKQDTVRVYAPIAEAGQGSDLLLVHRVAEALGIPPEQVQLRSRDTERVSPYGPVLGSRTAACVLPAVDRAAARLRDAVAAELDLKGDFVALLRQRRTPRKLRVTEPLGLPVSWDADKLQGEAFRDCTWHAALVDLAVDLDTGEAHVRRVITATEARPEDPEGARRQLEGAVLQGLGQALWERVDTGGRGARKGGLADYAAPSEADAPQQVTLFVGEQGHGLGEVGICAVAAAAAQAIEVATGAVLDELPMRPERILEVLP